MYLQVDHKIDVDEGCGEKIELQHETKTKHEHKHKHEPEPVTFQFPEHLFDIGKTQGEPIGMQLQKLVHKLT